MSHWRQTNGPVCVRSILSISRREIASCMHVRFGRLMSIIFDVRRFVILRENNWTTTPNEKQQINEKILTKSRNFRESPSCYREARGNVELLCSAVLLRKLSWKRGKNRNPSDPPSCHQIRSQLYVEHRLK